MKSSQMSDLFCIIILAMALEGSMDNTPDPTITELLVAASHGNHQALERLMPLVYNELRQIAGNYMRRERPGNTLQPTALVHEAYLRLIEQHSVQWKGRAHFFAMAAMQMRRILRDRARKKHAEMNGGGAIHVSLNEEVSFSREPERAIIALEDALEALEGWDKRKAKVVTMRFYGGLSETEIAEVLKISPATITRDWRMARAWLLRELNQQGFRIEIPGGDSSPGSSAGPSPSEPDPSP
jgi:RNA polymerase sigma factor (TIGR02999 family)